MTRTQSSLARPAARSSWHSILSFNPSSFEYLKSLHKGSQVYVEANYELREADPTAEPNSPQGQRQIFLRHGMAQSIPLYSESNRHECRYDQSAEAAVQYYRH